MAKKSGKSRRKHLGKSWLVELNSATSAIPGHVVKCRNAANTPIAIVPAGGGSRGVETQVANAVLMKEAPRLLDALEAFVDFFERHGGVNNIGCPQKEFARAKRVIKAATSPVKCPRIG